MLMPDAAPVPLTPADTPPPPVEAAVLTPVAPVPCAVVASYGGTGTRLATGVSRYVNAQTVSTRGSTRGGGVRR